MVEAVTGVVQFKQCWKVRYGEQEVLEAEIVKKTYFHKKVLPIPPIVGTANYCRLVTFRIEQKFHCSFVVIKSVG